MDRDYKILHADHVEITADISKHSAALASIALRLDSKAAHENIWKTATYLARRLDQKLQELRE